MSKKAVLALTLILLTNALLGLSMLTRGHVWGDDFAAYIDQAKSILSHEVDTYIERNTFTVTQSSHEKGHQMGPAAYPWGFPLLLTPVYAVKGNSPLALKLPGLLTYLSFLLVYFFLTKRHFSSTESLLAVSLFAFNPGLLSFLDYILSDIPFLFVSTLSILIADIYSSETNTRRRQILAALSGLAIFMAFFIRTQGLVLLGAVLLFLGIRFLRERENRGQIVKDLLITVATFGLLWGASSIIFPGGQTSYLSLYADFSINIVRSNIVSYSRLFGEFFSGLPGSKIVFGIFTIFFAIGLFLRWKADLLFILYAGLYLLILWTWPEWQGYRFIFPMLPFFIYFAFQGARFIQKEIPNKYQNIASALVYTMCITISILFLFVSTSNAVGNLSTGRDINGPYDPFSREAYDFIKDKTPSDSIVVFFKPRAMRLMTDRDTLALTECDRMLEGDYLALSKKAGENLQIPPERIDECNLPLEKVFENRRFLVYQILK